jgi:hypothetical protein
VRYLLLLLSMTTAIVIAGFATPAQADQCDKLTYFTFSAPVALPGVTLPAGTYRFSHPDCDLTEHILRVSSQDGTDVYGTFLVIPDERVTPSSRPVVIFGERLARTAKTVKALFYPGETIGEELIYPRVAGEARPPV